MRRMHLAVFPFAVAALSLAGSLATAPLGAQTVEQQAQATQAPAAKKGGTAERAKRSERDDIARRQEWFYHQRRYPLPMIPGGARQQALHQRETNRNAAASRRATQRQGPGAPMAPFGAWTPIGPTPTNANGFDFLDFTHNNANFSGRINAIAVDPKMPNIIYLGGADGGMWKSMDSGFTWVPLTDTQPSLAIGAIAIDPTATSCGAAGPCQIVYVGTGEENNAGDNYYGAGILKTIDGGTTFTQLGASAGSVTLAAGYVPPANTPVPNSFVGPFDIALGGSFFSEIVVNPTNSSKLLAAARIFENADKGASSGIFCSDNSGVNWLQVVAGAPGTAVSIAPDGVHAFGALGNPDGDPQNGVYMTANANATCASQTWTLVGTTLPSGTAAGRISLALAPSSPTTLFAAVANPSTGSNDLLDVFKSTNGASSWAATHAPNICTPQCWYDMTIRVHPNNANVVIFGGSAVTDNNHPLDEYLLRSSNGGSTWTDGTVQTEIAFDGNDEIHVDQHAIAFTPPTPGAANYTMLVGNDGGVWFTPIGQTGTAAIAWTDANNTLTLSQFYPGISIHPSSQLVAIGGLQDNGSQKYDAGTHVSTPDIWTQIFNSDGGSTYIDPASPNVNYVVTELFPGDVNFIQKSFTNGDIDSTGNTSYSPATGGINSNDLAEFIPQLAGDPTPGNNRVLYYPTCNIYQSLDGGGNWASMPTASICGAGVADYVAIAAAADGNTVYAVDNIGHVHVTTSAISGTGATWTDVSSAPLPAASSTTNPTDGRVLTSVAVSPTKPSFALVGYSGFCGFHNITNDVLDSAGHIFETTNGGASWTDVSGGAGGGCANGAGSLPNTPVNAIVIDPEDTTNSTFYVATDVGVFFTVDNGTAWTQLDQSPRTLPDGGVLSLTLRDASRTLRAGLHGRGVWDFQLPLTPSQLALSLASITPVFAPQGNGSPVTLTVNGQGFTGGTVNFNGAPLSTMQVSATQLTATIPMALLANPGTAAITVTNGAVTSNAVPFSVEVVFNASAPAPPNDAFATPIVVPASATSFTDIQNTANATPNTGGVNDPTPSTGGASPCLPDTTGLVDSGAANSIWYAYTPAANARVEADTVGSIVPLTLSGPLSGTSQADTILQVVTGSPGSFTKLVCNDDIVGGAQTTSEVIFNATAGTTYFFMVSQFEGVGGVTVFNLNATPAPTVNSIAPNSGTGGASFPVTITGSGFTAPVQIAFSSSGGTFSNIQVVSGSMITATLTLSPTALIGTNTVTVTETTSGHTGSTTFQVTAAQPTIASINLSGATLGSSAVPVTVTGTNFLPGSMLNFNGTGITVSNLTVTNSTTITATLMIAANATTGTQLATVTTPDGTSPNSFPFGVGTDFMMAANPTTQTVTRPGSGTSTITITPAAANSPFPAPVQFTVTGAPSESVCTLSSASFTAGTTTIPASAGTAASTQVMLSCTTTAPSMAGPRGHREPGPLATPPVFTLGWAALLFLLSTGFIAASRERNARLRWTFAALLILALAGLNGACGGSSSSGGGVVHNPGTPPGPATITVMATSGNAAHSATFTMNVQ